MNKIINAFFEKPEPFEPSPFNLWTNKYSSEFIFDSHFSNDIHGGSKDKDFISSVIKFIEKKAPSITYNKLIDIGCGPGVYTNKLAEKGYNVTGLDISQNSIIYASKEAKEKSLNVTYYCQNLLEFKPSEKFDVCLLLYNIYDSFKLEDRKKILSIIYNCLNENGKFLLDVASIHWFEKSIEIGIWDQYTQLYNFDNIIDFYKSTKYKNDLILIQTIYLKKDHGILNFYNWIQCFSVESIKEELLASGFKNLSFYGEPNGESYTEKSDTIAIICQK